MFGWLARVRDRAEDWRDSRSDLSRGRALLLVAMLGSTCCLPLFGGVYGDCGGPQAQECVAARGDLIKEAFVWFGLWVAIGVWLAGQRRG